MPRTPRAREESGIHHVVVQGLDHQKIFEENDDKDLYLDIVLRFKERFDMRLYAYCIMPNHAHLLLKEGEIDISSFMRRSGSQLCPLVQDESHSGGPRVQRAVHERAARG